MSARIRTLHAYVGMLIAPAVLFFAATGLLQIYNLHEAHPGYTPPALIEKLSAVHQDQHFLPGHGHDHDGPPDGAHNNSAERAHEPPHDNEQEASGAARNLLKAFFAAVAVGLIFSTLAGIWMALQQPLRGRTHLVLLLVGTLVPAILAALTA